MIDHRLRNERILQEAADPEVAVILLDVVLGYGSHPDPAAEMRAAHHAGARHRAQGGPRDRVRRPCLRHRGRSAEPHAPVGRAVRHGHAAGEQQCAGGAAGCAASPSRQRSRSQSDEPLVQGPDRHRQRRTGVVRRVRARGRRARHAGRVATPRGGRPRGRDGPGPAGRPPAGGAGQREGLRGVPRGAARAGGRGRGARGAAGPPGAPHRARRPAHRLGADVRADAGRDPRRLLVRGLGRRPARRREARWLRARCDRASRRAIITARSARWPASSARRCRCGSSRTPPAAGAASRT